jgi:hypothetical protein
VAVTVTEIARRLYALPITAQLAMYGAESVQPSDRLTIEMLLHRNAKHIERSCKI